MLLFSSIKESEHSKHGETVRFDNLLIVINSVKN